MALNSPAPGLLLSLSRHFPSDRHLSATSLRLYSNPPPLGSFLSLNSEGGQLNPPPPPGRAAFQPPAWYALEMRWNPLEATSRVIAPYFRATGDGFLVWGSFPRLVHSGIEVDPEGLPCVLSRLTLALLIPGYIPLGSFGRWAAQSAPTPQAIWFSVFLSAVFPVLVRTWADAVTFIPPDREQAEAFPQVVNWIPGFSLRGGSQSSFLVSLLFLRGKGRT